MRLLTLYLPEKFTLAKSATLGYHQEISVRLVFNPKVTCLYNIFSELKLLE